MMFAALDDVYSPVFAPAVHHALKGSCFTQNAVLCFGLKQGRRESDEFIVKREPVIVFMDGKLSHLMTYIYSNY